MRSNWAGETGAVWIYRGCHAALPHVRHVEQRLELQRFVEEHQRHEEAHLEAMCAVVATIRERSIMPAQSFGWVLGYASTVFRGARGMYITTHAVETFVEEHYGDQISRLGEELARGVYHEQHAAYHQLLSLLQSACADEVHHKEDAAQRVSKLGSATRTSVLCDQVQFALVYWGSRVGAAIAKRI